MCDYEGHDVIQPGCSETCSGCNFTLSVITSTSGTDCVFDWTVKRLDCDNQPDETFTGTTTLPCGETKVLHFYCDRSQTCEGYALSLEAHPC